MPKHLNLINSDQLGILLTTLANYLKYYKSIDINILNL